MLAKACSEAAIQSEVTAIQRKEEEEQNDTEKESGKRVEGGIPFKGTMNIQRAPNAIEREKNVDVTPRMAGKLMLHYLPVQGTQAPHLIEELRI
jgi:hypothetical protein